MARRAISLMLSDVLGGDEIARGYEADVLTAIAMALYQIDVGWYATHPDAPSILSIARYAVAPRSRVEAWPDAGEIQRTGVSACHGLACALAAELTLTGTPSVPVVIPDGDEGDYHVVVRRQDTGEILDPSKMLGMGTERAA